MEARRARKRATVGMPPLSDIMSPDTFNPRPVNVKVPTMTPAPARSTATGIIFWAPSMAARMIRFGVSHSLRSLLMKLVTITATIAHMAAD